MHVVIVECYLPLPMPACCTLFLCFVALQSLHPSTPVFTDTSTLCLHSRVGIGLLIDQSQVSLALSSVGATFHSKLISLPIVLLSPGMLWWDDRTLLGSTCIALCMLPFFNVQRKNIDRDIEEWRTAFGEIWPRVEARAQSNADQNPLETQRTYTETLSALESDVNNLEDRLNEMSAAGAKRRRIDWVVKNYRAKCCKQV